jgi:hypothetical protein
MAQGIDYASASYSTTSNLQSIKNAGYGFIGRYYSQSSWKALTRAEAERISDAGLYIVAVYQDANNSVSYFTYSRGRADCERAINQALAIGQPYDTTIYFAVDFEANTSSELAAVVDYFEGVQDRMREFSQDNDRDDFKIGVYGSYDVVRHVYNNVADVVDRWQTYAWSGGKRDTNAEIYQYENDVSLKLSNGNTITVDKNESNGSAGGFQVS